MSSVFLVLAWEGKKVSISIKSR